MRLLSYFRLLTEEREDNDDEILFENILLGLRDVLSTLESKKHCYAKDWSSDDASVCLRLI